MIGIIDYGVGNVQSFINIFNELDIPAQRAITSNDLVNSTHLILPGVGHFNYAMEKLNASGMRPDLENLVLGRGIPILGVCVGMQMLAFNSSEGTLPGLGWVPGQVISFSSCSQSKNLQMPHIGWNNVDISSQSILFSSGFDDGFPQFYFLHSYFFEAQNKLDVVATADYGVKFSAAISRGHVHGVQFHPEKSHRWGAQLLKNFSEL